MAKPSSTSHKDELQDLDSAIAFIDILKHQDIIAPQKDLNKCIWLSACLCLSARLRVPANLSKLARRFVQATVAEDQSPFALSIGEYLNDLENRFGADQISLKWNKIKWPESKAFFHCLLPAWIFQLLAANKSTYTSARLSRSTAELGRLTQWFTPSFVTNYLVEQIFESQNKLDTKISLTLPVVAGIFWLKSYEVFVRRKN